VGDARHDRRLTYRLDDELTTLLDAAPGPRRPTTARSGDSWSPATVTATSPVSQSCWRRATEAGGRQRAPSSWSWRRTAGASGRPRPAGTPRHCDLRPRPDCVPSTTGQRLQRHQRARARRQGPSRTDLTPKRPPWPRRRSATEAASLRQVVTGSEDLEARPQGLYGAGLGAGDEHHAPAPKLAHVSAADAGYPHAGVHSALLRQVAAFNADAMPVNSVGARRRSLSRFPTRRRSSRRQRGRRHPADEPGGISRADLVDVLSTAFTGKRP
jgi:hypothetical protein